MKSPNSSSVEFPRRPIVYAFIYGSLTCIIALLIQQALLTDETRYTSNWTSFLVLALLSSGAYIYFGQQLNESYPKIRQLLPMSLAFGATAGMVIGLFYYINASLLDPAYLQKTLDSAYKSWTEKGYSNEAIAYQVELTSTFQNPLKWSLTLTVFYSIVTTGLSLIIGYLTCIPSVVDTDDLRHA